MQNTMWRESDAGLCLNLSFRDFKEAFQFMTDVAELAEQHQHHPDWRNVYNRVSIKLNTHDAGHQVTEKDRALAKAIVELDSFALAKIDETPQT